MHDRRGMNRASNWRDFAKPVPVAREASQEVEACSRRRRDSMNLYSIESKSHFWCQGERAGMGATLTLTMRVPLEALWRALSMSGRKSR